MPAATSTAPRNETMTRNLFASSFKPKCAMIRSRCSPVMRPAAWMVSMSVVFMAGVVVNPIGS